MIALEKPMAMSDRANDKKCSISKTLLISDVFPPKTGGSGRWFWELYRRLPRQKFLIAAGEDPRQCQFDETHDLPLVRLPLAPGYWGIRSFAGIHGYGRAIRRLVSVARYHRIQHIHAARVLPEGLMAWCLKRLLGIPYLCYVHGEDITCTSTSRELRWLARRVVAGAAMVIANSNNTAKIVQESWSIRENRVHVLNPGVDTQQFHPAPADPQLRRELGWDARPVILTVGRLQKRKGHDMMIRALNHIRRQHPTVLYAIVGDGEERQHLEELVQELNLANHVIFHGEINDAKLLQCYQQCDLFALPNRQVGADIEGFGMVLVEAQACGKPVLAGDSGGTVETMEVGKTGMLVDCTHPESIAIAVTSMLAYRQRLGQMGMAARYWANSRFEWAALSKQALKLFTY